MKVIVNLVIVLLSVISTVSIPLTIEEGTYTFYNANSIIWVVLFLAFCFFIREAINAYNKRLFRISMVLSFILSLTQVIGGIINKNKGLSILLESKKFLFSSMLKFAGMFIVFSILIILVFKILEKKLSNTNHNDSLPNTIQRIKNKKYVFFIIWVLIFMAYIPYFINYLPGIMTPDSFLQFDQDLGIFKWNNHHPILHTFFISICSRIGALFNNYNIGVGVYSIMQMAFVSCCFAFCLNYMLKKGAPIKIVLIFFIYYMIYPVHALYSITMWKDIPFAVCMLILTIIITDLVLDKEKFFKRKKNTILLILFLILVSLFRNNGIYVIALSFPFFIFQNKKYFKNIIIIFGSVFIFYALWKGVFFKVMDISDGSIKEALSIPMQQLARTLNKHSDQMSVEEKQEIYRFFTSDTVGEEYYPIISDPVKNLFNDLEFSNNKKAFIKVWLKNLLKYPGTYIDSFLCNSYGYWYPEAQHWVVAREIYESDMEEEQNLNLHQINICNLSFVEKFNSLIDNRNIPLLSMMFSIGAYFYVCIICFGYVIYIKRYNLVLLFIPILMLWLTCLASPVFGEFRYIYSLFTCLPILSTAYLLKNEAEANNL